MSRDEGAHIVLGASAVGLASAAHTSGWAVLTLIAAANVVVIGMSPGSARGNRREAVWRGVAVSLALVAGVAAGNARLDFLEVSELGQLPRESSLTAVVLEAPRERAFGVQVAAARIVGGESDGERILLRVARPPWSPGRGSPRGVAWPRAPVGAIVTVRGRLRALPGYEAAQARQHTHAELRVVTLRDTGRRRGGVLGALDGVRRRAEAALDAGLSPPNAALARGMVLGQDHALDADARDVLRTSGLAHIVAASGANIALLATLMMALGGAIGIPHHLRLILVLVAIVAYVPLAGAGPSIQRAGVMGVATAVAALASRPAVRWYALLLAAVLTLGFNPLSVDDPGWQLSFAAVVAIALIATPLRAKLGHYVPTWVADATAVTVAATVGTAPLLALHFDRFSVISPVANVLVAPVVAPITWLGTIAGVIAQGSPAMAHPFLWVAAPLLGFLLAIGEWAGRLPGAEQTVGPTGAAVMAVTAVLILAGGGTSLGRRWTVSQWRRHSRWVQGVVCVVGLGLGLAGAVSVLRPPRPPAAPTVSFLDIGQGDATLLQAGGNTVLVDTGRPDAMVIKRLREAGVRRLEALVITHQSADHDGGAARVLARFPVGVVLDGGGMSETPTLRAARTEAHQRGVAVVPTRAGQVWRAGPIELRVVWPRVAPGRGGTAPAGANPNLTATVLVARVGALRVLLPADAEGVVTAPLRLGRFDVLKVAHHGSDDPELPALLAQTRPAVAVIPVGSNTYGHPHPATLASLRASGSTVRRTDRDGTVRVQARRGGGAQVVAGR